MGELTLEISQRRADDEEAKFMGKLTTICYENCSFPQDFYQMESSAEKVPYELDQLLACVRCFESMTERERDSPDITNYQPDITDHQMVEIVESLSHVFLTYD